MGQVPSPTKMALAKLAVFGVLFATLTLKVYAENTACFDAVPSCNTSTDYFVYKLSFPYLSDYVSIAYENISIGLNISIPVSNQNLNCYLCNFS